jgi:hypothetical protein
MKNLRLSNEFTTITLLKYTLNICYQCLLTSPISIKVSILDEHLLEPSAVLPPSTASHPLLFFSDIPRPLRTLQDFKYVLPLSLL